MVLKKIIFQNRYVELETLPPLHGENHLKFPFWLMEPLPKQFSCMQVKPAIYVEAEYQNVLHLTIGGDAKEYGDRTPAVWIHPEKGIMISSAVNGTSDYGFFCKKHLPSADKWTRYAVEQVMNEEEEEYVYSIFINDVEKHSGINKQPKAFSNVGVYASNPWDPNPKNQATIRNLEIKSNILSHI